MYIKPYLDVEVTREIWYNGCISKHRVPEMAIYNHCVWKFV